MQTIIEAFTFTFFTRGLIIGCLLSILCALIGNFVVMRKEAVIGHSISNFAFLGIAAGIFLGLNLNLMILISCMFGISIILYLQHAKIFSHDSILELTAQVSLASAIVVISLLKGYRVDLMSYLFGDILAISKNDMLFAAFLTIFNLIVLFVLKDKLLQSVFSKDIATSAGTNVKVINIVFMILLMLTVAVGIRIVGVILISTFLVIPPNIAKLYANNFKQMMIYSSIFGVLGTFIGLFASYLFDIPSGAMIILVLGVFLIISTFWKRIMN
jgi:zinc transport system permease protein